MAIEASSLNFNVREIGKIIDLNALQSMMDDLYDVTKIGFSLIDLEGNLLVGTGWQDICRNFHRKNSQTLKNCLESDLNLTREVKEGEYRIYECKNGLIDIVTPLFIGGKHVANIFSGQFLFTEDREDLDRFVAQAEKYNFDKEAYICAYKNAPRWERGKVECLMEFYAKLTHVLSKKGLANLKLAELIEVEKENQKVIKENQEDLNRAQAVAKIGSWRVTLQGELRWSDETYRMFGLPVGIPMSYEAFLRQIHPDDCKYVDQEWQGALKGKPYDIEHRIIANGRTLWVHEKAELEFDGNGKLRGGFGTVQDITERKIMQESLENYGKNLEAIVEERTKQLKDSERLAAIGATAGMVGHDIRNPLQAIASDVYLLKSDLITMPECEMKRNVLNSLEGIENNVYYINKIVADLQDFARPLKPHPIEADLKGIIDNLLEKNGLPENITINVQIEPDARKILADADYINRILFNLVTNAIQAMPKGGKLTICAYKESKDVVLSVEDTGVGIPEAVKGKLFTPMFTTKSKGQGFGLPVIKRMTEALGGTVSFESQEGTGTKFIVRFPSKKTR